MKNEHSLMQSKQESSESQVCKTNPQRCDYWRTGDLHPRETLTLTRNKIINSKIEKTSTVHSRNEFKHPSNDIMIWYPLLGGGALTSPRCTCEDPEDTGTRSKPGQPAAILSSFLLDWCKCAICFLSNKLPYGFTLWALPDFFAYSGVPIPGDQLGD